MLYAIRVRLYPNATQRDFFARTFGCCRWVYNEALAHDGFAEIRVEIRILRRGQKEVILHCGKQYRFVVDYAPGN